MIDASNIYKKSNIYLAYLRVKNNFIDHLKHLTTVYHFKLCF